MQAGLSPWEALAAATRNPAQFLGEAGRFGTITEGRRGDVVLLDADPTVDIRNARAIAAVLVGGRLIERDELDELIDKACEVIRGS